MNDLLDVNFDDVVEPRTVDPDDEYELRITSVTQADDRNGAPYILPRFEVVSDPYAKEFSQFIRIPYADQTPKECNQSKYKLLTFLKTFGIDASRPVSFEDDLIGATGWAILGVKDDDYLGEEVNVIKKFIPARS